MTFRIQCPIFTARQIMRHRTFSYNEISGRYAELAGGYYVPLKWYKQDTSNKQGVGNEVVGEDTLDYLVAIQDIDAIYHRLLDSGISREQARMVLPVSTFTSFFMTGNLLNWAKFLKLRLTEHAQYEVWWIASFIAEYISNIYPELWEIIGRGDLYGTTGLGVERGHFARTLQERGFCIPSSKTIRSASTYSQEIP